MVKRFQAAQGRYEVTPGSLFMGRATSLALLGLRAAPKDKSGISSEQATLGVQLALPGQLLAKPVGPPLPQQAISAAKRSFAEAPLPWTQRTLSMSSMAARAAI